MSETDNTKTDLWAPPAADSGLRAASKNWREASAQIATEEFKVAYAGGIVTVAKDATYYVDSKGRVLIGWHGSYNPPRNMNGDPIVKI